MVGAACGVVTNVASFDGVVGFTAPLGGLVQGADGNFYGTTLFGGTNDIGNVFMMTPARTNAFIGTNGLLSSQVFSVLANIYSCSTGGPDGNGPVAPLVRGQDGFLYTRLDAVRAGISATAPFSAFRPNGVITNACIHSRTGRTAGSRPTG